MRIGGGDDYHMPDVIVSALALAGGCYAEQPTLVTLTASVVALLGIVAMASLAREGSNLWIFFLAGFVAAPALFAHGKSPYASL